MGDVCVVDVRLRERVERVRAVYVWIWGDFGGYVVCGV